MVAEGREALGNLFGIAVFNEPHQNPRVREPWQLAGQPDADRIDQIAINNDHPLTLRIRVEYIRGRSDGAPHVRGLHPLRGKVVHGDSKPLAYLLYTTQQRYPRNSGTIDARTGRSKERVRKRTLLTGTGHC